MFTQIDPELSMVLIQVFEFACSDFENGHGVTD